MDILGEPKHFQESYFGKDSSATQELAAKILDDFMIKDLERSQKNFAALNNFGMKLLFYPASQGCPHLDVLETALDVRLQIGQHVLNWNSTGLVIPQEVPTKHIQPVLSVCPMESMCASPQRSKVNEAIQTMSLELQTQLVFDFVAELEKVTTAVVQVAVDYNRHKEFDEMASSNADFVADVCAAVGIPPSNVVKSLQQLRQQVTRSQYASHQFSSHLALDNFVFDLNWYNKTASLSQVDLQYLISQYFHVHVLNWQEKGRPQYWKCDEQNCQLSELERLLY